MEPIRNFNQLTSHLKTLAHRKRVVVVCANDEHTQYAISRALDEGFADFLLVGDTTLLEPYEDLKKYSHRVQMVHISDPDEAAREAVSIVRHGGADILMKGLINTDNLLHAILNKEQGLLPKGKVLTHLAVMQIPAYDKLIFFSDPAVIPSPTLEQHTAMIHYAINTCHAFGIDQPRVALIHFTEKVSPKFQHSVDYATIVEQAKAGAFGNAIIDGPMDVKTACEQASGEIKGIHSPIQGQADVLIFPNIESANVFYKTVTLFSHAEMASVLQGPICPVVVTSRSDSVMTKYYSLASACLTA